MLSNYLKLALRNLWKNKLFVLINVLGLGLALACCIVAYLNWQFNAQFDHNYDNRNEVYRVNFVRITNGRPVKNGSSPAPLGEAIRQNISEVDDVVRYYPMGGNFKFGADVFGSSVTGVDPGYFDLFNYNFLHGTPEQLSDIRAIYISDELVRTHFPDHPNPVGQTMTYLNGDEQIDFRVAGVFERPPLNSSFRANAFINYENAPKMDGFSSTNWAMFNNTFVRIKNKNSVSAVERQLQQFVAVQNEVKKDYMVDHYYLDPFDGMAVRAMSEDIWNHWTQDSLPTPAAVAPGIMALLLLLLACFNFTNTSIAIANRRIKEIGIRKVLGSSKKQLVNQFLGENMILAALGMLFGLVLAALLVPAYSAMWVFLDIELNLFSNPELIGFILLLLVFTGFVAGSYPAFYISRFQPTTIFRGTVKFSGTNTFTRVLLTLQFSISMIAIISAIIFTRNAHFQEHYDMGFDIKATLSAFVKDENGFNRMRNQLSGYDDIASMAGSRHSLTRSWYTDPAQYDSKETDVSIFHVGSGYLESVGATLIAGRDFRPNSSQDSTASIIVNEEFINFFGWTDPIGKRIMLRDTLPLSIIGVVRNIYYDGGLWNPLQPMMLRYASPNTYRFLTIRTDVAKVPAVKALMDEKWKVAFPDELSSVEPMSEELVNMAEVNINIRKMFVFLGLAAILLSMIGLFSLVSLNLNKRMKEIGVRKVLGASLGNISAKMSKEFIIILSIASVLGAVAGHFLAEVLMASIWAYYVPPSAWAFISAILILLIIGVITILSRVIKVATVNPSLILQDE